MHRRSLIFSLAAAALCGSQLPASAAEEEGAPRIVALTFDDGPHPLLTPQLLDMLDREEVRATFYVIGECAAENPHIVRRAFEAGHEIGNHSWSHPVLTRLSPSAVTDEISTTDELLIDITGELPNTIRPPYGSMNDQVRALGLPRSMILWNIDTNDWRTRNTAAVERAAVGRGGIVLMHDIHPTTVAAVPEIIRYYKAHDFRFVTISHYVRWQALDGIDMV